MRRPLKRRNLGIVLILILSTLAWSGDSDLKLELELESNVRTLRVGERTNLRLRIVGAGVGHITDGSEGIAASNPIAGSFVYEFAFAPQREGQFTFGPYQLSFNGQPLVSNAVSLFVLPRWDGRFGTFFRTDRDSIVLGDKIELSMETWGTTMNLPRCQIKWDEAFTSAPGGSFMFTENGGASTQVYYARLLWWITPKKAGEFKITRDLFESFPEGVVAPNLTVMVTEPAQKK